ncbi:MAG: hypothetical protein R6V23_00150, partial [Bacteroidales bacterium]
FPLPTDHRSLITSSLFTENCDCDCPLLPSALCSPNLLFLKIFPTFNPEKLKHKPKSELHASDDTDNNNHGKFLLGGENGIASRSGRAKHLLLE